jgi:glutamate carboxypeptidase
VEPEKGANAVSALADKVLAAAHFARPEVGTTVNVTTIHGGQAGNVIPDYAVAGFDVRVADPDEAGRIDASFRALAGEGADGVRSEVCGGINRMPMVPTDATRRLWAEIKRIGEGLGMEMPLVVTGGGSDGNFTAALGVPTIDAMGPRGGRAHSADEFLELDSILPNLRLAVAILSAAAAGHLP